MIHPILDAHHKIAWDIDGTLFEGVNSAFFCAYIMAHPEKEHHLVTFRDQRWALSAHDDLLGAVDPDFIKAIHACPQRLYHGYATRDPIYGIDAASDFVEWKGMRANQLGCTLLVDDMAALVEPGCTRYGVAFLNALHPIPIIQPPRDGIIQPNQK